MKTRIYTLDINLFGFNAMELLVENKAVIGHFEDGKRLAFVYVPDADPDNFNAAEYMYGSSHEEE